MTDGTASKTVLESVSALVSNNEETMSLELLLSLQNPFATLHV